MKILHLSAEAFSWKVVPFHDWHGLLPLLHQQWDNSDPVALFFESFKGNGKSTAIQVFGADLKVPIVPCLCTEGMGRGHLVGYVNPEGDFVAGPLVTAILVANEVGAAILNLEELNRLDSAAQAQLNSLLDWQRQIPVGEASQVFRLNPGAKLFVTGTYMARAMGAYPLNDELLSRADIISLPYPGEKQELTIIETMLPDNDVPADTKKALVKLAAETRTQALGYVIAPRDTVRTTQIIDQQGLTVALRKLRSKFPENFRETLDLRIQSHFGKV
jgi:MoxR-like ATPase